MIRTNATPEKLHFGGIRCPLLLPSCLQEPKKCSRTNPKYSKVPNTNAMTAQMQDGNHYLFPIIRDCKRSFSDLSLSFAVHQCSGGAQTVDAAASASGLLTGPPWVKRSVGERGGERGGRAGPETTAPPWAAVARELDSWEWDSRRPRPDWDSVIFPVIF